MKIGHVCTRDPVVCGPETKLVEVARLMRRHHVGSLIVAGPGPADDDVVPLGIVTDRDLVVKVVADEPDAASPLPLEDLRNLSVAKIMGGDLVVAREDEDVTDVLTRMGEAGVRRVPVLDARGRLLGIFALDDTIKVMGRIVVQAMDILESGLQRERDPQP